MELTAEGALAIASLWQAGSLQKLLRELSQVEIVRQSPRSARRLQELRERVERAEQSASAAIGHRRRDPIEAAYAELATATDDEGYQRALTELRRLQHEEAERMDAHFLKNQVFDPEAAKAALARARSLLANYVPDSDPSTKNQAP
jgi:hypothetical protein